MDVLVDVSDDETDGLRVCEQAIVYTEFAMTYAGDNQQDCAQDLCKALTVEVLGGVSSGASRAVGETTTGGDVQSGPREHPEEVQLARPLCQEGNG